MFDEKSGRTLIYWGECDKVDLENGGITRMMLTTEKFQRLVARLSTQTELTAELLRLKLAPEGVISAVSVCSAVTGGFHWQVAV